MTNFLTNSGVNIAIQNITIDDINLHDIAHHLTKICRYGGALALDKHYSVAQHSLQLVAYAADNGYPVELQRALLLHDATEAYLGDVVSGVKHLLPDYCELENHIARLIAKKYDVEVFGANSLKLIKELDTRILLDEALYFIPEHYEHFSRQLPNLEPLYVDLWNEYGRLSLTYRWFRYAAKVFEIKD